MRYEQNHILPQKTGTRVYGIVKGFQKVHLLGLKASGGEKMKKIIVINTFGCYGNFPFDRRLRFVGKC